MDIVPTAALLSRIQLAFTLSFHILFPALTIGLSGFLVLFEVLWLWTGNTAYYQLCRFWIKIFALAFGIGVVSGLVLSYEFGTNFSGFSQMTGNVLGPLMSYEVLTAFFLEAGFLGITLFGWERVSKSLHLFSTLMVALGTNASAFWILSANSWMHTPAGFRFEDGVFYADDWFKIIFNPSFLYRFFHMVTASYLTVIFFIAGISAWYLLKQRHIEIAKKAFTLATGAALFIAPLQLWIGDLHGLNTLAHQPIKIAAMEGRWETAQHAPLVLFAVPDIKKETNHFSVDIPGLASLILTHRFEGEVLGLKSVAAADRPYVPLVFFSFRIMVGIGLWFIGLALWANWAKLRRTFLRSLWLQRFYVMSIPLGFVAVLAGWFTTEVGRQPWAVHGLVRTVETVSNLPASVVLTSLIAFIGLYTLLLGVFIYYLIYLIKKGPEAVHLKDTPDELTGWLEHSL